VPAVWDGTNWREQTGIGFGPAFGAAVSVGYTGGKPEYFNGGSGGVQINVGPFTGDGGLSDEDPNGVLPDGGSFAFTPLGNLEGVAYMHTYLYDPGQLAFP